MKSKRIIAFLIFLKFFMGSGFALAEIACPESLLENGVIKPSANRPDVVRADGVVKLDWSRLLACVDQILTRVDGQKPKLVVGVLVNGEEKMAKEYPETQAVDVADSTGQQRDYYLEVRDGSGRLRHRTDLLLHESLNAQNVPGRVYAEFLKQNGMDVSLPASLKAEGFDETLTRIALRLGYEKTVWVLAPKADPKVRAQVGDRDEVEVVPILNGIGRPVSVSLIEKKTQKVLATDVKPENFFFKVDAAFNGNAFFWDDMFVSMATVAHHPELARATVDFWLNVQDMNGGTIPREVRKVNLKSLWFEDNVRAGLKMTPNLHYTNPYLIHRVADQLYRYHPSAENLELLKRVSKSIERYTEWMEKNRAVRDARGKLVGFVTDGLGSGGDNARGERGNTSAPDSLRAGWIDLLAQMADMQKHLARHRNLLAAHAKKRGAKAEAEREIRLAKAAEKKAESFDRLINSRYWNAKRGFYFDLVSDKEGSWKQDLQYETIFAFWPLVSRSADAKRVDGLISRHLRPEKFGGEFPLPSNARDLIPYEDRDEDGYWNKWSHWPSVGSITMDGFKASGRPDISYGLATGYLRGMHQASRETVYEFYGEARSTGPADEMKIAARPGQHRGHKTRADFAGWGKVPPVYDLIEHVIGIEPHESGHIRWNLLMPLKDGEEVAISNLALHGQVIRELKLKRVSASQVQVAVRSERPVKIEIANYRSEGKLLSKPAAVSLMYEVGGDPAREKALVFALGAH